MISTNPTLILDNNQVQQVLQCSDINLIVDLQANMREIRQLTLRADLQSRLVESGFLLNEASDYLTQREHWLCD